MHVKPIATTRSATGVPTGRLAVWWVIASETVVFGGLLVSYIMNRLSHPEWGLQAAHTNEHIGGINTLVLLLSSYAAVKAHQAAQSGDGKTAAKRLMMCFTGGLLFAAIKFGIEWPSEIAQGYTISAGGFWWYYYTAAGIHAAHVIAGCIIMLFVAASARKGEELQRVELIGIYWHFVDLIWVFLFPLLYIAK